MWLARLRDPHDMGATALVVALLLACETVLCVAIVQRIPCTSPPTTGYMQAGRGFDQSPTRQPLRVCSPARPAQLDLWSCWRTARMAWGHADAMPDGCVDTQIRRSIGWRTCRRCWCVAALEP